MSTGGRAVPIHDWARVDAGTFHDFHQGWTIELRNALNRGLLPPGYFAMADQRVEGPEPDVVTFHNRLSPPGSRGGVVASDAPPAARLSARARTDRAAYARKANRVSVRDGGRRVVAVIEIVSPGNKDSAHAVRSFTQKVAEFLRHGVHVLVVDLFPPTPRDPDGLHQAIWDEVPGAEPFEPRPADKPLTAASFDVGVETTAYVEPLAVGDRLPDMPLFLEPGWYVRAPLEATYQTSWEVTPAEIRQLVEPPG